MKHGGKKIWNKTNSYIAILIEFISEVRVIKRKESRTVTFTLGDMVFEYDEENSEAEDRYDTIGDLSAGYANAPLGETVIGNIVRVIKRKESRTVTFTLGDMVFEYDEENSEAEDRYDTIGDLSAGYANAPLGETVIGNIGSFMGEITDIVFVVYKIHVIISNVSSRTQAIKKGTRIGQLKILLELRRNTTQPSIPGSILVKI